MLSTVCLRENEKWHHERLTKNTETKIYHISNSIAYYTMEKLCEQKAQEL